MYKNRLKISINHGDESLVAYIVVLMMFFVTYMSSLSLLLISSRMALQGIQLFAFCLYVCFKSYKKTWYFSPTEFNMFAFWVLLQVLRGFIHYQDNDMIYAVIFCVFFFMAGKDTKWQVPLVKILGFMGIIYALATLIFIPLQSVYINQIASLYTETASRLVDWYSQGNYAGITDHYSTNGMMLINGLLVIASFFFYFYKNNSSKFKYLPHFLLMLVALVMCGKRAHLLFGMIALILGYFVYTSNEKNRYFKYFGIFCGLLILLMLGYYFVPAVNNVISRFSDMGEDVSILGRYEFWNAALKAFEENKIWGIGWFGFRTAIAPKVFYTGHAHNVYIQLLCETGLVGFAIMISFFILFLVKGYRALCYVAYNKDNLEGNKQVLVTFAFMYQIYFLLYCMTGNPLYDVYVFPVYFASCSISAYYCNKLRKGTKKGESWNTYLS